MKLPTADVKPGNADLWGDLLEALTGVMKSGQFIMGPQVKAFEQETAQYLGVKHAIGVNSGTDALVLALRAAGIGAGDEVITSPFTFFATAEAVSQVGATPVFVDIEPVTFNINAQLIEPVINERTKAILPVHLFGHAAELDPVMELAKKYGVRVIEDAAQAFGAEYKGEKIGSGGDAGCFSFFPTKNLGAFGDGGLLATNNREIAEMAGMLRQHGAAKKYFNKIVGYNSRLDEIQAAVLRVKLPYLDGWNEARRRVAEHYNRLLQGLPGIVLPREAAWAKHIYHQYTIRVLQGERNKLRQYLARQGIAAAVYYPVALHQLPVYLKMDYRMPEAEQAAQEVLSLPMWPQMSEGAVEKVCNAVAEYIKGMA